MKLSNALEVRLAELSRWGSFVDECHEAHVHRQNIDKEDSLPVASFIQPNNRTERLHHCLLVKAVGTGAFSEGETLDILSLIKEKDHPDQESIRCI